MHSHEVAYSSHPQAIKSQVQTNLHCKLSECTSVNCPISCSKFRYAVLHQKHLRPGCLSLGPGFNSIVLIFRISPTRSQIGPRAEFV
jgi:hypothetical protein